MELYDVMRTTGTARGFGTGGVELDTVYRVLDAARFAPSGGNRQGWRVVVVTDAQLRGAIGDLYQQPWAAYLAASRAKVGDNPAGQQRLDRVDGFARHLGDAPVLLVMCVELAALTITDTELDRPSIVGGASLYPFVHNVLLGLRAEGLAAALTTLIVPRERELRTLLGMPDGVAVGALIAVGPPAGALPSKLSRRPVEEFAFLERFGGEPLRGPATAR